MEKNSNKDIKKKRLVFLTPKKLKNELNQMGETCNKKEVLLTSGILLLLGFLMMKLFALKPICLIPIYLCLFYILPFILLNNKKRKYEIHRFKDASSYLSHMGQSFRDTKSILTSLKETENKYREGRMKDTLQVAIATIQNSSNIKNGEKEALAYIEEMYGCKKMHSFHDFLIKAETRGGDCEEELTLLEKLKNEWAMAVDNGYHVFKSNIYLLYFEMSILLGVLAFIQAQLPYDFSIRNMNVIQAANVILVCLFAFIFKFFDKKTAKDLLKGPKEMSSEEVEKGFATIAKLDIPNNLKRGMPYALIFLVLFGVMFFFARNVAILAIGLVVVLIVLNIYNISYFAFYQQIKAELQNAFPEWVFDVILLLQKENVQVAIIKSIDNAPPVLQHELRILQTKLIDAPTDSNSYLTFLDRFEIDGVEDAMRTLYSISQGTGTNKGIATIAEANMHSLAEAEKRKIEMNNAYSTAYIYLPILPCVFALIVYGGALLYNVFTTVMQLLG